MRGHRGVAEGECWGGIAIASALAAACANGGATNDFGSPSGSQPTGSQSDASVTANNGSSGGGSSSSGSSSGGSSVEAGDDGAAGGATDSGDDSNSSADSADDGGQGDDGGDDGGGSSGSSGGSSSSSSGSGSSSGAPTYACVTSLSPAPVCDSAHDYCLCTENTQCNSNGLNVVNNGGCKSGHCGSGTCTGGQVVDKAGCSVVGPTCNVGGNQACPAKTVCAGGPASGYNTHADLCGGQLQCCWCTSDSACSVSGKCIDDSTAHQCTGTCTGSGTDWDGMHCQLTKPGIPMCETE